MKTISKALILLCICLKISLSCQTFLLGSISGLAFRKNTVQSQVSATDTLKDRLMNYHLIKDSYGNTFKKLNVGLNQPTFFIVGNKFGGTENKVYARIGSSTVSNLEIRDFNDSLKIDHPEISAKILTFTKKDFNKKINPIVFFNKRTDKKILIPEVLVFDRNLSNTEIQQIETFLSLKYGITINDISEKNYISSTSNILWDSKKSKNYNYRVTGIGRDDAFELYQKQSINSNQGNVAVSVDSLKLVNNFNTGTIENQNFLLWGDNNQALEFKEVDLLSQHPRRDMKRMWKVHNKRENNQYLITNLYAVLPELQSGTSVKLRLFQNENNYQNDISTDIIGKKINDTLYVFKDITWNIDNDEIDYFTFSVDDQQSDINVQLMSSCEELGNNTIKISAPSALAPFEYTLQSLTTNQVIVSNAQSASGTLVFSNLNPDNYKLSIHKQGYSTIIRTFDLQGIINQNIDSNYSWQGTPIELDLNTNSFLYTLTAPDGQTTTVAPFMLTGIGNYQLKIKNKLGCETTKALSVLSSTDYVSLQNNSLFKKFTVSPNPSQDGNITVHVELKSPKPLSIKIFNGLGVLVKQGEYTTASDFTIPMSIPAVAGYYNIKVFIPEEGKGVNFIIY